MLPTDINWWDLTLKERRRRRREGGRREERKKKKEKTTKLEFCKDKDWRNLLEKRDQRPLK